MSHKSEDYKIYAVKYYLKNDVSVDEVCDRDWSELREDNDPIKYTALRDIYSKNLSDFQKKMIGIK
jgi:hypothetical protein